ncbi:MAG TPA: hypothetical protein VIM48_02085 [Chthoniobacterales bacterium]
MQIVRYFEIHFDHPKIPAEELRQVFEDSPGYIDARWKDATDANTRCRYSGGSLKQSRKPLHDL